MTDKNPPRLVKYDRWGHDVSEVHAPRIGHADEERPRQNTASSAPTFRREAEAQACSTGPLTMASGYLLNQAEIGMSCAMGADAGMVQAHDRAVRAAGRARVRCSRSSSPASG